MSFVTYNSVIKTTYSQFHNLLPTVISSSVSTDNVLRLSIVPCIYNFLPYSYIVLDSIILKYDNSMVL